MPTLSSMIIPPPKSWEEFEEITLSALQIKWGSPNLTRNGRQGQEQNGVDIFGEDDLGRCVGVQCKHSPNGIDVATVREEIAKAENFEPEIDAFYIAISAPTDAKFQKQVRLLSSERVAQYDFPIGVFFWDDLIRELVKNEAEMAKHYPQLLARPSAIMERKGPRLLSLLDISYFGLYLQEYMFLILGEIGNMVEDPEGFQAVIQIVESCVAVLYESGKANEILSLTRRLADLTRRLTLGQNQPNESWRDAENLTASINRALATLEYNLAGKALAAFTLGRYLGSWNFSAIYDGGLKPEHEQIMLKAVGVLSPDGLIPEEIAQRVEVYKSTYDSDISSVHIPGRVYSMIKSMIRYQEL